MNAWSPTVHGLSVLLILIYADIRRVISFYPSDVIILSSIFQAMGILVLISRRFDQVTKEPNFNVFQNHLKTPERKY